MLNGVFCLVEDGLKQRVTALGPTLVKIVKRQATAIKVVDGTVEVVSEGTGSCLPAVR